MSEHTEHEQPTEEARQAAEAEWNALARRGFERYMRRERRQSWTEWHRHLFFGFRDALMWLGLWALSNFVFLAAIGMPDWSASGFDAGLATTIMLVVFGFAWAGSVGSRWFMERRRIIAHQERVLAKFKESDADE